MTSLRGPDPYAIAEDRLAPLLGRRPAPLGPICRALHESIPTYTWVGLARREGEGLRLLAQRGAPRRPPTLPAGCAALLAGDGTAVVHDVAAAPAHLACFPGARALIAAPAGPDTLLLSTSAHRGAYGLADRALLELVARHLAASGAIPPEE